LESWKAVEAELVNNKFDFPIWFAHRTEKVEELYQEIKKQEGESLSGLPTTWFSTLLGADSYRLSAGLAEASKITPFTSTNIQVHLSSPPCPKFHLLPSSFTHLLIIFLSRSFDLSHSK
jgi:hypothetical protein